MEDSVESILNHDWPQKQEKEIPNAKAKAKKKSNNRLNYRELRCRYSKTITGKEMKMHIISFNARLQDTIHIFFYWMHFWLSWIFVAAPRPSLVVASGSYSFIVCDFLLLWVLLWQSMYSRACMLRTGGSQAQLLRRMWHLPRPGIEPIAPAFATGPLGKPLPQVASKSCMEINTKKQLYSKLQYQSGSRNP